MEGGALSSFCIGQIKCICLLHTPQSLFPVWMLRRSVLEGETEGANASAEGTVMVILFAPSS